MEYSLHYVMCHLISLIKSSTANSYARGIGGTSEQREFLEEKKSGCQWTQREQTCKRTGKIHESHGNA